MVHIEPHKISLGHTYHTYHTLIDLNVYLRRFFFFEDGASERASFYILSMVGMVGMTSQVVALLSAGTPIYSGMVSCPTLRTVISPIVAS